MSTVKSTNFTMNMCHRSHYDLWPPDFFSPLFSSPLYNHRLSTSSAWQIPCPHCFLSLFHCPWGWIQWISLIIFFHFFVVRGRKATYVICHPQILSAMPLCYPLMRVTWIHPLQTQIFSILVQWSPWALVILFQVRSPAHRGGTLTSQNTGNHSATLATSPVFVWPNMWFLQHAYDAFNSQN